MVDYSKLDLAFVLDTTGSMGSYINHAKENIQKIASELIKSEKCDLQVAIVNYRDHPPQDRTYITQIHDFTKNVKEIKKFLDKTDASGGGDCPEAVCCGLNVCMKDLEWRNDAVKVVILISDAPPHGIGCAGDGFPKGCPLKNDPVEIAHKMASKGITLYCAGAEPSITPYRQFFIALCLITGGKYVPLDNSESLSYVIIGGAREDISMEKLMAKVHNEYMKEVAEKGQRVNEDELTKRIHKLLNSTNENKINQLKVGNCIKLDEKINDLTQTENLNDLVKLAKKNKINLVSFVDTTVTPYLGRRYEPEEKHDDDDDDDDDDDEYVPGGKKGNKRGKASKRSTKYRKNTTTKKTAKISKTPILKTVPENDESDSENVNIDHARRMAKKVISRNK